MMIAPAQLKGIDKRKFNSIVYRTTIKPVTKKLVLSRKDGSEFICFANHYDLDEVIKYFSNKPRCKVANEWLKNLKERLEQ
jgi:hypothetical protein